MSTQTKVGKDTGNTYGADVLAVAASQKRERRRKGESFMSLNTVRLEAGKTIIEGAAGAYVRSQAVTKQHEKRMRPAQV